VKSGELASSCAIPGASSTEPSRANTIRSGTITVGTTVVAEPCAGSVPTMSAW
jgi:hypothetical protein